MRRLSLVLAIAFVVTAGCAGVGGSVAGPAQTSATDPSPTPSLDASANGTLEAHYLDVGQSAATLLITPSNETVLVDSGDWRDDGEDVVDYLERHDVTRLDYLVTSHADADHIGGHAAVIEHFETEGEGVGAVYDPGLAAGTATYDRYLDAVERYDVTLYEARQGDSIPLENATAEILAPPEPSLAGEDRNENSLVLHVWFGSTSFLFPGDTGEAGEVWLVERYGEALNTTVLSAGHHGSNTSSNDALLDATRPNAVVVSSAHDSPYGHPHEEVLQRLADRSIPTYWTATHGDVVVVSDGEAVTIATQQAAPTAPDRLRAGEPVDPANETAVEVRYRIGAGGGGTASGETASGEETTGDNGTVATPRPTPTDGGTIDGDATNESAGGLRLAEVHADAAGDDWENLDDEYLVFENRGTEPIDASGWQVADEAEHAYTFPDGTSLDPGETLTLYTGSGTDTVAEFYWGSAAPVWNNDGDTVIVTTDDGERVVEEEY